MTDDTYRDDDEKEEKKEKKDEKKDDKKKGVVVEIFNRLFTPPLAILGPFNLPTLGLVSWCPNHSSLE